MRPGRGRASKQWSRCDKAFAPSSATTRRTSPRACRRATITAVSTLSDYFQGELKFLGIESIPAFVREPEGNGVAELFIRTLKEQLLWVRTFDTVEELRLALLEFEDRYNREWLCERPGHQTPLAIRGTDMSTKGGVSDGRREIELHHWLRIER